MFMKEPSIVHEGDVSAVNATNSLRTIVGLAVMGTIFAIVAVNPLLEFITAFVYNSGY